MSGLILFMIACIFALAFLFVRRQAPTTSFRLPDGTVSAPAKGTPGYRTYMRDMRKASA